MSNTYPIKLQHEDLVPNSEVITVPGGQYVSLVRDKDYTIDYINGIVNIILTGGVAHLPGAGTVDVDLSITYRRKVNFEKEYLLDSHIEVFSEIAAVTNLFELQVSKEPINDVYRVFNKTTGELYIANSFLGKTIYITGLSAPRTEELSNQSTVLRNRILTENKQFANTVGLVLPTELTPAAEHPLGSVSGIVALTGFKYLVQANVDILTRTYGIEIIPEVTDIELFTGSTILRRCNRKLVVDTEYTAVIDNTTLTLQIIFTDAGLMTIGNNSVFYRLVKRCRIREQELYDNEGMINSEYRFLFNENFIFEVSTFDTNGYAPLTKFRPFVEKQTEVDKLVFPSIIVTNRAGTVIYEEGKDYQIDTSFRRLVYVNTSTQLGPLQVVSVIYIDNESYMADFITVAQDVVVVDYDYGTNSLDWSPSYKDQDVQETRNLSQDTQFITLAKFPANHEVRVYRTFSDKRIDEIEVMDVDITKRLIQVEPLPETTTYFIDYTAREQLFDPNIQYYVTYNYGARRRALIDNYAALLGINTGTTTRTEKFDMATKQSSVQLSFSPSNPTRIVIYATDDPDKTPITTVTTLDAPTNTIHFIPIVSSGNYTVEYPVLGYETEPLRTAIIALSEAFRLGPTKLAVERLVAALTGITPSVIEALYNGFDLTNDNTSDYLVPISPVTSPPLSDGSSSIEFVPSRFNTGLELEASKNAWVAYSALNDLRVEEGSFSFLLGTLWDGDDGRTHQLLDMTGTDEFTNRITLYKNQRNSLVFEVHDENSNLHRVTTDVTWIPRNEIFYLRKGEGAVKLAYSPAYTIMDFNDNKQSDIFEANRTEFVITPIFGGPTGLGLNITTLVQIPNDPTYTIESVQRNAANRLRTLANIYENHGAKLTIQTELSFIQGCQQFDNILVELYQRGHDVHLFLDIPQSVILDEDREIYILERRNALANLGIGGTDTDGVAGGYVVEDFATRFPTLGFEYASSYKNPLTDEALPLRTDIFRASAGPNFAVPDPSGQLIYVPGDAGIDFQKNPMIVQSFIPITDSLITAMEKAKPDVVNAWYFVLNINDFTTAEVVLFDQWLSQTMDPLVQTGKVFWRTLLNTYKVFLEYEKFLEVNRNRVRFVTEGYGYGYGGIQPIRALQWDEVTNILTFDPVDKAGYYLFSYISGFSKFEEAEHLITCTWKLHTQDGQPPMIKLFLDGELMNHKTFGDL